jgi:hypothetical protein
MMGMANHDETKIQMLCPAGGTCTKMALNR